MNTIHILVTLDKNYKDPLKTMLRSIFINNPGEHFHIHMIYSHMTPGEVETLKDRCKPYGAEMTAYLVSDEMFEDAPVFRHYTKAMYYRLLAHKFLPETLEKILYLDPDILVINSLRTLYETELKGYLYAGAIHTGLTNIADHVNKIRLRTYEADGYFNSGVLLMNLVQIRKEVKEEEIFQYVKDHELELILPDQDILNGLYGEQILPLDDSLYNYDSRKFDAYRITSLGEKDMDWVISNTVILHFCGKNKPWSKSYSGRFSALYKHYFFLAVNR